MRAAASSIVLAALLTGGAATAQTAESERDRSTLVGRPAPGLDGRLHIGPRVPSIDDLKGKVVLLFFWAHWCVECKEESGDMSRLLTHRLQTRADRADPAIRARRASAGTA
jgi:thiol-disulfide isomerase/thioredoxin